MTRPYHSASSIKLGQRCKRAWAYCYIDGLRDIEVPWSEIEAGLIVLPRVRSLSLGKAVHAVGEAHYKHQTPRWESLPGQIFASGLGLLPHVEESNAIEVEQAIGNPASPNGLALKACGVLWVGFRDLLVDALQIDYKTTSNIAKWALTPEQLHNDLQCALYTLDLAQRLNIYEIKSRWVYMETKAIRRAMSVDTAMSLDHALSVIEPAAQLAHELDTLERSADAPQNTHACYDYAGCQYHRSVGGPCDAQRSLTAFFTQKEGTRKMPIDASATAKLPQDLVNRFAAIKAPTATTAPTTAPAFGAAPAAQPAPTEAAPAPTFGAATPAPAQPAPAETPAPAKRTRKRKNEGDATAQAPGNFAERFAEATELLANAEELRETALSAIEALLAEARGQS